MTVTHADLGGGCHTLTVDHGVTDEHGRRLGGIATIEMSGTLAVIRVQRTLDGAAYGGSRLCSLPRTLSGALADARRRLLRQGKRHRAQVDRPEFTSVE